MPSHLKSQVLPVTPGFAAFDSNSQNHVARTGQRLFFLRSPECERGNNQGWMLQNRGGSWGGDAAPPLYCPGVWEKIAGVWCCGTAPGLYCPSICFHETKCHRCPLWQPAHWDRGVFLSPPEQMQHCEAAFSITAAAFPEQGERRARGLSAWLRRLSGVRWLFC